MYARTLLAGMAMVTCANAATIYLNGKIVTLDGQERIAESMVVEDGKIVAVGSTEEMRKLGGEEVDLGGKMVVPGFIETHCHSIGATRAELAGGYQELHSIGEVQAWVRERAKTVAKGKWIEVPRNEITRLKERRFPTPDELDAAAMEHPVLFVSVTKSVLNSAGWKALGVTEPSSKVAGGEVIWEGGRPALMRGGQAAVRALMPQPLAAPKEAVKGKLKELLGIYNSVGITSIFERATDRAGFDLFRDLAAKGELTTRMRATFRFSAKNAAGAEAYIKKLRLQPGEGDDWVRATCMKITVDGVSIGEPPG